MLRSTPPTNVEELKEVLSDFNDTVNWKVTT